MSTATPTSSTITARTQFLHAKDETYAYRRFGHGLGRTLLCLQHFMGTLDNWDPAVADALASGREVTGSPQANRNEEIAIRAVKAAAVQLSPVLYSREGTVDKIVRKIAWPTGGAVRDLP